jgi:host factor-I protein
VVLNDGTELTGWIEWYDKNCIKLNRTDAPNLLIFKQSIKYMFKEEELHARRRRRVSPARRPPE